MKMTTHNHMNFLTGVFLVTILAVPTLSFAATTPSKTVAKVAVSSTSTKCTFTRDLQLGVTGDDVKCLQKYLNSHGFVIAASGVGSPGHETGEYKALTEAAVIKWQKANKLVPAIGYFGAQSRLFFKGGVASVATGATTEPFLGAPLIPVPTGVAAAQVGDVDAALLAQVAALKAQLEAAAAGKPIPAIQPVVIAPLTSATNVTTVTDAAVRSTMIETITLLTNSSPSASAMSSAKDTFIKAVQFYLAGDLTNATAQLIQAKQTLGTPFVTTGTPTASTSMTAADRVLTRVQKSYTNAKKQISTADDDGKVTTLSRSLLQQAAKLLNTAQANFDDGKYSEVTPVVAKASSLIADAVDAVGKKS
jgi:peptidoglycan hydrolase-like protein with peptidoglycan-binding domain